MSDTPPITVRSRTNISTEQARDARARAWAFVFQCWQEKQMTIRPAPESDSCDNYDNLANEERSQSDLRQNAGLDAEGDRKEQTRKDKHGFVHR